MALYVNYSACSPLAVVASELTLGATAYEGRREASAGWLGGLALSKATIYIRRGGVLLRCWDWSAAGRVF